MNGKIDGLPLKPQDTKPAAPSRPADDRAQPRPADAAAGDTVKLTASALGLHQAEQALATTPAVDHGRVEAIKQSLADGTFRVDAQRIADRLLQADQALGKS